MSEMKWQPIETAPKDGTLILGYAPGDDPEMMVCTFRKFQWVIIDPDSGNGGFMCSPTHWQPLPPPPSGE